MTNPPTTDVLQDDELTDADPDAFAAAGDAGCRDEDTSSGVRSRRRNDLPQMPDELEWFLKP